MTTDIENPIDPADNLEAFAAVVNAMKPLDRESRVRLLQSIVTFFDLSSNIAVPRTTTLSGEAGMSTESAAFSEDRSSTPKQFLLDKSPATDVDRVACLAYYLTHYRATPHFKTIDISKLNTEAAQIKFSNAAQAVDNAAKAGLVVQSIKGQKQLSAIGELYVQSLPDRDAARDAIAKARPRKSRKKVGA